MLHNPTIEVSVELFDNFIFEIELLTFGHKIIH